MPAALRPQQVLSEPQACATAAVVASGLAGTLLLEHEAQRRYLLTCAAAGGVAISLAACTVQRVWPPRTPDAVFALRLSTYAAACTLAPLLGQALWQAAGHREAPLAPAQLLLLGHAGFGALTLCLATGGLLGTLVGRRLAAAL